MTRRGLAVVGIGLVLAGCSSTATPDTTPAPKPLPITLEQALGCGPKGLVGEVYEPLLSRVDWDTPEKAATGMGAPDGRPTTARRWSDVSTLPSPINMGRSEAWVVYDARTQLPLSLVSVTEMREDIVSATAGGPVAVGHYGGGITGMCKR